MIVSPFAIDGRPIDNGNKTFSVCPICLCTPPWAKTCEDLIAYLHILETELSGTYHNTGYIFRSLDDPLNPSYQHFLGALTFVYEGISYVAFVTCACSFVVWKWNDKYSIHEQSDACTCLVDMLMAMYVTQVGGTEYGEGFMYSPPKDEGGLATKTTHGGAVVFTFGEQNYIFLRSCDKEDCSSFNIREMAEGEYYREMSGVCDCPEIIDFTLSAEESGANVMGEGVLVIIRPTGKPSSYPFLACYLDGGIYHIMGCGCSATTVDPTDYPGCLVYPVEHAGACKCYRLEDILKKNADKLNITAHQMGSHTVYQTSGGTLACVYGCGEPGYIDWRVFVGVIDNAGVKSIIVIAPDNSPCPSGIITDGVALAGYATLFAKEENRPYILGCGFSYWMTTKERFAAEPLSNCSHYVAGTIYYNDPPGADEVTHEEALALGAALSETISGHGLWIYCSPDVPHSPVIDREGVPWFGGSFYDDTEQKIVYVIRRYQCGPIYSIRYIETNRGVLTPDGEEGVIEVPTIEDVIGDMQLGDGGPNPDYIFGCDKCGLPDASGILGGDNVLPPEDPCPDDIDPDEFE